MSFHWCTRRRLTATGAVLGLLALSGLFPAPSDAGGPSLGTLHNQLSQQQSRQQQLRSRLSGLASLISSLTSQISLVQTREAVVREQLARDQAALAATQTQLLRQRRLVALLRARLAHARMLLSRQLVSNYEAGTQGLLSAVLESNGFTDLLDRITFLSDAEHQQQRTIGITRTDKARADAAVKRLSSLEVKQRSITKAAALQERALAGMNSLLQSKQASLSQAQAIQQAALSASQARAGQLQGEISKLEAQQAAARRAAEQRAATASTGTLASSPAFASGWAIPYPIVLCESGGQNLPPNSAGASGYYQIIPSTWRLFGGSGPAAYLTSKAEQDAVASRIWAGGSGAGNWVCAGIVGIH